MTAASPARNCRRPAAGRYGPAAAEYFMIREAAWYRWLTPDPERSRSVAPAQLASVFWST